MLAESSQLWLVTRRGRPVSADQLAHALAAEATSAELDFRTTLLIRDGLDALEEFWGADRFNQWIGHEPACGHLQEIRQADLGAPGFTSLRHRLMDPTTPADVLTFFRELGSRIRQPVRLEVGGSTSLILSDLLSRQTDDIDVVDEVPAVVRNQHDLLSELAAAHDLHLAHFQSHYLPTGWRDRLRWLDRFGVVDVYLVDVYDILVGKLTSARRKDKDDLRVVSTSIDKATLAERLLTSGAILLGEPKFAENARENWYIVYGEALPDLG